MSDTSALLFTSLVHQGPFTLLDYTGLDTLLYVMQVQSRTGVVDAQTLPCSVPVSSLAELCLAGHRCCCSSSLAGMEKELPHGAGILRAKAVGGDGTTTQPVFALAVLRVECAACAWDSPPSIPPSRVPLSVSVPGTLQACLISWCACMCGCPGIRVLQVAKGHLGRKSGQGFYKWQGNKQVLE